jgi:hypothetical protein
MALREVLGDDVRVVHEHVDNLLDSEDALMVFIDGDRAVSYGHGFAASPSQLEFLALEIERAVRRVVGPSTRARRNRKDRNEGIEGREHCDGRRTHRRGRRASGPVLRVAEQNAAAGSGRT